MCSSLGADQGYGLGAYFIGLVTKYVRVRRGQTRGFPWEIRVQLVLKLNKPMPSLLDPAPNRLRTNLCLPLSARQMIEMAVSKGNGYCGIL